MQSGGHLTDAVKTIYAATDQAAGTSDVDTSVIDMSGYDACRFTWLLADVTDGSVLEAQVFKNSASSTSSPTPVEVTEDNVTHTADATDADDKLLVVDVIRPGDRYVFSRLKRTTQNAVVNGCICELYRARDLPVTQDSSVLAHAELFEGGDA